MGSLLGLFVVNEKGRTCLQDLVASKKSVYFGEVLGKHSEIQSPLSDENLVECDASQEDLRVVLRVFKSPTPDDECPYVTLSGFNPLPYLEEEDAV